MYPTSSTSATATIELLRRAFATHGWPDMLVSDNGTEFASKEFGNFMAKNGILPVKTAPRHPSSNGFVERSVRTFKDGMKKLEGSEGTLHTKLSRFLLAYRSTPPDNNWSYTSRAVVQPPPANPTGSHST